MESVKITDYAIHRTYLKIDPPIGDSQVLYDDYWITVLELFTNTGLSGIGFEEALGRPIPGEKHLKEMFEFQTWKGLKNSNPWSRVMSISDPRGGNARAGIMPQAVETALWDIIGKMENTPLYRLFGGTEPKVRAYGSTLGYHLDEKGFRKKLEKFVKLGMTGVKIKVGHPDVGWELERMRIVREVMGAEVKIMADTNEGWSVKETIMRLNRYHDEGYDLYWIEDPIKREDYQGYATLRDTLPFTRINAGEMVGVSGKLRLLEYRGVDVLNLHGRMNETRMLSRLASHYGVPISLGNTLLELGVHLAASLPNCLNLEYSDLVWNKLVKEPVQIKNGYAVAPDRSGHGLELDRDAIKRYSTPE